MVKIVNIPFKLTNEYTKEVCKIGAGKDTCRYLVMGPDGFTCGKFDTFLMPIINDRMAKNTMGAQGDNCDALLGEIIKAKSDFLGKKVEYAETMPSYQLYGTVADLLHDKERKSFTIYIKDDGKVPVPHSIDTDMLGISDKGDHFVFEISGVGALAGSTKIFK